MSSQRDPTFNEEGANKFLINKVKLVWQNRMKCV